ncbi:MAG: DUF2075 domain-containing protein [Bacteroidales bacterium]|nr:DUF2075 domain-containing protein [Bacteroidales bacterium]
MKNSFIGYTYQKHVTTLLLAKMDAERIIDKIEIEAVVNNNFDDVKIISGTDEYYFQIKDIDNISIDNLKITTNSISINGKSHKLSEKNNIVFFRKIAINPNCEILGFPALQLSGVYLVSLSRTEIDNNIEEIYKANPFRKSIIEHFFNDYLDNRKWIIERKNLPTIDVFKTQLIEPTVKISREFLMIENILLIEGKPGVGKSHLVCLLEDKYPNNLLYRFFVSSQEGNKTERLKYKNFISDFSKKLFKDLLHRNEETIIQEIKKEQRTVIIDGLDHVENYNRSELEKYIYFIDKLKESCKTIILSRPLHKKLLWKKHQLGNWNNNQTQEVLNKLYHISDYSIGTEIFSITGGYPILVKYVAEHYKKNNSIPKLNKLDSVDSYYEEIIKNEKGKQSLSLFLCSRSFFMKSEIHLLLDDELATIVNEFINEHPYLFEIRLNRISFFHDSFTTYLLNQKLNYSNRQQIINEFIHNSIINQEKRFLSRFSYFDLTIEMKKNIVRKFSSIEVFKDLMKDTIDFEALRDFYFQIREELINLSANDLELLNYYDLSLIINIVSRDHVSTLNSFLYTYVKVLLFNSYSDEDITSSKYLFAMLYYVQTNNPDLLYNITSDDYFDTRFFYNELNKEIEEERTYFQKHNKQLSDKQIEELLKNKSEYELKETLSYIFENVFIHKKNHGKYTDIYKSIEKHVHSKGEEANSILDTFLYKHNIKSLYTNWSFKDAKRNIFAFGNVANINDYCNLSLNDFILKNNKLGSFDLRDEILNFIRLSLHENRKIDISNISLFWTKYYQRKDYSLSNIDSALRVFEQKGFVNKLDSCILINSIQEVSEKGYRELLADYIIQHSPKIISFIVENFNIEDLRISWFDLPNEYINSFPDNIFNYALNEILKYHRHNKQIEFKEIQNVVSSNRFPDLKNILNFIKYSVRISKFHPFIEKIRNENIDIIEFSPSDNKETVNNSSESHYNHGILNVKDKEFILKKGLKCHEIADFSDGWYSALADLEVYKMFDNKSINENIYLILYNAILGKVKSINSFYSLSYFPGNIPKLISDYQIEIDIETLFHSFSIFTELSMFNITNTNQY